MSNSYCLLTNNMTPLKFYFWFGVFVELFPIIPIIVSLQKWQRLTIGIRFFILFLVSEFLINCVSNYYLFVLHISNLFLFYFYPFFQNIFILTTFWHFFKRRWEQILSICLIFLSNILIILDFTFISKIGYNYLSNFGIDITITLISFYYVYSYFPHNSFNKSLTNKTKLIISTTIVLQFFIKTINIFVEKNLLESQFNGFVISQTRNIYAYFMLFCLLLYTYAINNVRKDEK